MSALHRPLFYSALNNYSGVVLQLVSTAILSRLLTPEEIGTFAIASVFTALASGFRDFGVAEYLVQSKEVTVEKVRAAFSVNIAVSWAMALVVAIAAFPISHLYNAPTVRDVMLVQAFNFVLIPFGAINMAWLRREMEFKPIFYVGTVGNIAALALSSVLAMRGYGAMALAWSSLLNTALSMWGSMLYRPTWFPRRPGRKGWREALSFGSQMSGLYVINQFSRGMPEMIIGKLVNVSTVALYSRAGGLAQMFVQLVIRSVQPLCIPFFSQALRSGESIVPAYRNGVALLTGIGWPFLGFLALAAYPVIRLVYGAQWLQAIPLAQMICLSTAVDVVYQMTAAVLVAHGLPARATRMQVLQLVAQVGSLLLLLPFGFEWAGRAFVVASLICAVLAHLALHQTMGLRTADVVQACSRSALVTVGTLAPLALLLSAWTPEEANYLRLLAAASVLTLPAWLLSLRISGHPLWQEIARMGNAARSRLAPST
jgi:O-antigen/teichoic acid export membrane protein